jgi:hypothetical protein
MATAPTVITESKQYYLSSHVDGVSAYLENGDKKSKVNFIIPYFINYNENTLYQTAKVLNAYIPYSFYIINDTNNKLIINSITLNIPNGNYNAFTLLDQINTLMTDNNILATLSLNTCDGTYILSSSSPISINTTISNCINSIIGLDVGTYIGIINGTKYIINFVYPVNTGGIHNIFIKTNLLTNNLKCGGYNNNSHILKSIPVNVEPFGIIQYSNYENVETIIRNHDTDYLEIELLDDYGNYIDFNGLDWSISIEIKSVNKFIMNDSKLFSWE